MATMMRHLLAALHRGGASTCLIDPIRTAKARRQHPSERCSTGIMPCKSAVVSPARRWAEPCGIMLGSVGREHLACKLGSHGPQCHREGEG